jgi:TonB family protein
MDARAAGMFAFMGWIACVAASHAQSEPAAADSRQKLFVSEDQPLRSGAWSYQVLRGGGTWWCSVMDAPSLTYWVVVNNQSDETLDCSISLTTTRERLYANGQIGDSKQVHENAPVVEPHGRQAVLTLCATDENFESATANCVIRQPPLPWNVPDGCSYSVVRDSPVLYPPSSRRHAEQGPVYVSFSLAEREGRPKEVAIASSSGFARLDEAALRHVRLMKMRTTCPGVHYRMRLSFRLDEYVRPVEPVIH